MGGIFLSFFYRLSAINGLKFIVIGDKSKNDKNATYSSDIDANFSVLIVSNGSLYYLAG